MIASASSPMNNHFLEQALRRCCDVVDGESGFWSCAFGQRDLLVITDETHNRMRVMTPIIAEEKLSVEELRVLLAANFDRALDAKFAISRSQLWSVFVHPLSELTASMVPDVVNQVATLADNYGTTYASTMLTFAGGE